jgi:DNA polymerase bacteriophage-type
VSTLLLDTEAFSTVPITSGVHAYAEHAELLLVQHAWDDGPVHVEDVSGPGEWERYAPQLQWLVDEADEIIIQNSAFDRTVLRHCGVNIPVEKITDTMVLALMHSLPAGLDKLCEVLGVPTDKAKDKAGKKLIQLFCKEQPRNRKVQRATRETHPAEWAAFKSYGASDIEAMREVLKRIPRWNDTPSERELWLLDQKINDRGVKVDLDLARSALRAFERTSKELAQRSAALTDGAVGSMTQRQKLLDHLSDAHDFDTPDLTKGTVTAALKRDDISGEVRELLEIRQQAAATSPAKYKVLLKAASSDERLRGTIQFCGASRTGRDAGRLFQPQNLPRPTLKPHEIERAIRAMKADCEDLLYENVSELCSNAVRGCLVADEGKKLVVADLSNIEGRVLAWLAGEEWKLEAFRAFDRGVGHDLYKLTAGNILRKRPEDITKDERQAYGKVPELALGYQGGPGAFMKMAANYGVDLPEDEVVAIVKAWRKTHPNIVRLWYALDDAAKAAIRFPKEAFEVRGLRFDMRGTWLRLRLPSGRYLSYPNARIGAACLRCEGTGKTFVAANTEAMCPECDGTGKSDSQIRYDGINQYTRQWEAIETYGGKFGEQSSQAAARDVFKFGAKRAEAAGYAILLPVHDENITETPDNDNYTAEGLSAIMATNPSWALGLPLAAAGHEMQRYSKQD